MQFNVAKCNLAVYNNVMIKSIRHKGLKRLWEKNDTSKLPAAQILRISIILTQLDDAETKEDMNNPGYHLHELKGDLKGFYSVRVTGNYRIIFRLEKGNVFDINYTDYH